MSVYASTIIVLRNDLVLAVSRVHDPTDLGLPGGKVEPGETSGECAIRELQEETTLVVTSPLMFVHAGFSRPGSSHLVTTWYAESVTGEAVDTGNGTPFWVPWQRLFTGKYEARNRAVYARIQDILKSRT